ncbi:hypothetical protein GCM10010430_02690 [Kitasatospora cystarginea]|uniref:Class IIb bacteriocin, lactobin A/cerein 7B family n=1 Tax=Kitasatospora cystarginea TaxID=58350 RepID=A0ABN3DBV6_9ACTN
MQENINSSLELELGMQDLELDMQELEGMDVPDFWSTFAGVSAGISVTSLVSYVAASLVSVT